MVRLPNIASTHESFVRVRPNQPFNRQHDFLIGFTDINGYSNVYSKKSLVEKFVGEFHEYDQFPFLQWNFISCFDIAGLISKISNENISKIFDFIAGEVQFEYRKEDGLRVSIPSRLGSQRLLTLSKGSVRSGRKAQTLVSIVQRSLGVSDSTSDFGVRVSPSVRQRAEWRRLVEVRELMEGVLRVILAEKRASVINARPRDEKARLNRKYANTRIGKLRETYGSAFAQGFRSDERLVDVLLKAGWSSLSDLIRDLDNREAQDTRRSKRVPPDRRARS